MKITLLLCFIVLLTGCLTDQGQVGKKAGKVGKLDTDSPIIISDGSTHVRHKGVNNDFHIVNEAGAPHVVVSDPGFTATTLECVTNVTCPGGVPINLVGGWVLDIFDVDSEDSTVNIKVLTMKSPNNQRIVTTFHRNPIDPEFDSVTGGVDIIDGSLTFRSLIFKNGDGSAAIPLTCAASPCKIQIHYVHP